MFTKYYSLLLLATRRSIWLCSSSRTLHVRTSPKLCLGAQGLQQYGSDGKLPKSTLTAVIPLHGYVADCTRRQTHSRDFHAVFTRLASWFSHLTLFWPTSPVPAQTPRNATPEQCGSQTTTVREWYQTLGLARQIPEFRNEGKASRALLGLQLPSSSAPPQQTGPCWGEGGRRHRLPGK